MEIVRTDEYEDWFRSPSIMSHVMMLRNREDWPDIDRFMGREYLVTWLDYKATHPQKEAV